MSDPLERKNTASLFFVQSCISNRNVILLFKTRLACIAASALQVHLEPLLASSTGVGHAAGTQGSGSPGRRPKQVPKEHGSNKVEEAPVPTL